MLCFIGVDDESGCNLSGRVVPHKMWGSRLGVLRGEGRLLNPLRKQNERRDKREREDREREDRGRHQKWKRYFPLSSFIQQQTARRRTNHIYSTLYYSPANEHNNHIWIRPVSAGINSIAQWYVERITIQEWALRLSILAPLKNSNQSYSKSHTHSRPFHSTNRTRNQTTR